MALRTTIGRDSVPEGFVVTTKHEALEYQKALLNKWKKDSDVQVSQSNNNIYYNCFY